MEEHLISGHNEELQLVQNIIQRWILLMIIYYIYLWQSTLLVSQSGGDSQTTQFVQKIDSDEFY